MSSLSASFIIADDVRREASGKLFVVGMYTNDIIIPLEQFIIPQMSLIFAIEGEHPDRPPAIFFEVTFPGEETKTMNVPLNWPSVPISEIPIDRTRWTLKYVMPMGIITLRAGAIKANIGYANERVPLTPFWIRHVPPATEGGPA